MADKKIHSTSYKDAGVDIDAADSLIDRIKPLCQKTSHAHILENPKGFAGLLELPIADYRQPVMLSATDGVGTKMRLTQQMNRYDTIGIDLVAMCVNDILVHGGKPLAFLDYYSCGKLNVEQAYQVIQGIAYACQESGASLVGGETAEMPGSYREGEYDLAGFAIGLAEKDRLLPKNVSVGDHIIGIASNGVHANGFSLIHHIIEQQQISLDAIIDGRTLGETLLAPTSLYVKPLLPLIEKQDIHGLAHITGGGITENLPRVLPDDCGAEIVLQAWQRSAIFDWIQEKAGIDNVEMLRTFNCGIGMCAIVAADASDTILQCIQKQGLEAWIIGRVCETTANTPRVLYS